MGTGHLLNRDISGGNGSINSPTTLQNYDNGGGGGGGCGGGGSSSSSSSSSC